ncbi:MAG: lytic transglycosylase domain-containing protein [Alphaproteobacteria bacterium]
MSNATPAAATGEHAGFAALPPTPVVKALPGTSTWRRGTVIRRDDGQIAFLPGPPEPRLGAEPAVFRVPGKGAAVRPPDEIIALVHRLAPRYGLAPKLVLAVIETESAFSTDAVSSRGAVGLMQLIPATARRFGVRNSRDAEQNLRGGMAYLRWLLSYFRGDLRLALAGYNAGEGAVRRVGGVPNYTETRNYVRRILTRYGQKTHPFDSGLTPGAPFLMK